MDWSGTRCFRYAALWRGSGAGVNAENRTSGYLARLKSETEPGGLVPGRGLADG